jgi:hypothetical protein
MRNRIWIGVLVCVLALGSAPAFAQGASAASALTGVVVDKDGGVIPGVTVTAKNDATGVSQTTTTNSSGAYSFPTMDPGTYTVSISLQGFKRVEIKGVRLLSGTPGNAGRTLLEIGAVSEVVEVKGGTDLIRTQSPTVSSTVSTEFISSLPRSDRNALSFLIFLPGVQTSGGAQNSRNSTIAGLPQNTINITIDGVTTSNLLQSGDGFFTMVTPRLDAVEEVTLSTAAAGADASGNGTTQVRFVTRSGTNQFNASAYDYFQHRSLNTNTFFNKEVNGLDRPRRTIHQYGGRIAGPIMIPGLFDGHGKAFFFFNQEEIYQPLEAARARTIARVAAMSGDFTYNTANPQTVNVLTLATTSGQLATIDPTVATLLAKIRAAATTTGNIQQNAATPNTETFNYQVAVAVKRHAPTTRVDINLSQKHRLSGSYYLQRFLDSPDTLNNADATFPGFPAQAGTFSYRTTGSSTLRSTLSSNIVNEVLVGWQSSPSDFFGNSKASYFTDPRANQDGYAITLGFGLTNAAPGNANTPQARNTVNWNIDDNFNWLRGDHSLKFGFSFTRINNWLEDTRIVPAVTLGLSTATTLDPSLAMFNNTNFPTATATDLNNARALYGLLTGRVTTLPGTGQLNNAGTEYVFNGVSRDAETQDAYSLYATDSWRWKPNVTITAGVRYTLQMPMVATVGRLTGSQLPDICGISGTGDGVGGRQCNLFRPGLFGNPSFTASTFAPLSSETKGYNLDTNNFAPSIGVNWRPMIEAGLGRRLLGDPEQATVSGGYSRTFNLERVDRFRTVYVGNPGTTVPATRGTASTNFPLVDAGDPLGYPLLFSQKSRLTVPAFQTAPTFPLTALSSQSIFVFDENIRIPYTDSWAVGLQRSIGRDMAVEVRYIGNVNKDPWASENWNVVNYRESGLLGANGVDSTPNQFALAQANLRANLAAGNGGTFAYTGAPGTTPLPLFLAAFSATPIAGASNTANYSSTQFTNTTWITALDPFNPNPQSIATNLWTGNNGVWKANAVDSGIYPSNLFVMNPAVNQAQVTRNQGSSKYNSLQLDVRRRFSQGLAIQGSYTYARGTAFQNNDLHLPLQQRRATTIPHALKMLWTWDLPVGRGRRFGTNLNSWMDGVLGGWQFSGSGRVQVPVFRLANTVLVGMSQKEAQELFKQVRVDVSPTGAVTAWNMPKDVVDNTVLAYSTSAATPGYFTQGTPTGRYFAPASHPAGFNGAGDPGCVALFPNDCAPDMFFYGNWFGEFDFKFLKKFKLPGRATFEFDVEVFNALKATNFANQLTVPANTLANTFRINGQDSNARTGQLVWRVTW